jgi:hypothetical protein
MDEGTVIAQCAPRELVAREDPRVRAFLAGGQRGGACA